MSNSLLPTLMLVAAFIGTVAWEVVVAVRSSSVRGQLAAAGMHALAFGFLALSLTRPAREREAPVPTPPVRGVVILGEAGGRVPSFVNSPAGRNRVDVVRLFAGAASHRGESPLKRSLRVLGVRGGAALLVLGDGDDLTRATAVASGLRERGVVVSAVAPATTVPPGLAASPVSVLPPEPQARAMAVAVSELTASLPEPGQARVTWTLDGRLLGSRLLSLERGSSTTRLEHAFVVPAVGLHRVRVDVSGVRSTSSASFFKAGAGVRRAVVVEGRTRPVYRALRRAIDGDASFLVRGTCASDRKRGFAVLPRTEAEWSSVDVVVLGNLAGAELPVGLATRLARFVDDGGGLLVIAGDRNLQRGGWQETDLSRVLPVSGIMRLVVGPFDARPAGRVGLPRPFPFGSMWAGLESPSSVEGAGSWRSLPELESVYESGALHEDGAAPVVGTRPGRTLPLLAWRKVGGGVCAVVLSDDLWRWRSLDDGSRVAHDAFWRDLLVGIARRSEGAGSGLWLEADSGQVVTGRTLRACVYVAEPSVPVDVGIRIQPEGEPESRRRISLPPGPIVRPFSLNLEFEGIVTLVASTQNGDQRQRSAPFEVRIVGDRATPPPVDSAGLEAVCVASGGAFGDPPQPGRAIESFLRALGPPTGPCEAVSVRTPVIPIGLTVVVLMGLLAAKWAVARVLEKS